MYKYYQSYKDITNNFPTVNLSDSYIKKVVIVHTLSEVVSS